MGYVTPLNRPYDARELINVYIYTRRKDFPHEDFGRYYQALLKALQEQFHVNFTGDGISREQRVLVGLFNSTVNSLLQITNPWAGYLEAGLLHRTLRESSETETIVGQASEAIADANAASTDAHWEMLLALFSAAFGECTTVVTSEQLLQAGFDDSLEPKYRDYLDYL